MNSLRFPFIIALVLGSFSISFSQTDTDLANLTPEQIQTLVSNFSAEELQQMQPLCQQLFPDSSTAQQAAEQMENGQVMLTMCQAVATKLGSPNNPLSTDNPLSTQQTITPPADGSGLSGLYKYYSSDYSLGPDGTVIPEPPVYWYFFPDGYVYKGKLGHEAVNCASTFIEGCDTYSVSGGAITFGSGQTSSLSQSGGTLLIDDQEWTFVTPESFTLEGSYESSFGGSDFLSITTLTFRDDGTFTLDGATGVVSSDTQTFGNTDATGGQSETTTTATAFDGSNQSGTYVIRDNSLILSYADGRTETLIFDYSESAEDGVYGVYVGGTLYY